MLIKVQYLWGQGLTIYISTKLSVDIYAAPPRTTLWILRV